MVKTRTGDDFYPGTAVPSETWPGLAACERGVLNTMSPKYYDASGIVDLDRRPPITWIHGSEDKVVADGSMFDLATLGQLGAVPGWPGEDVLPPQPMVQQTRAVLDEYRENGGKVPGELSAIPGLILTTIGAKSGEKRSVPLAYQEIDGRLVIIASMAGAPQRTGFGSDMKQRAVIMQLRGTIEEDWRAEGLEVAMAFPLDALVD